MPKFLQSAQVINESNEHVTCNVEFESGNVELHTLQGQKDHVTIQRQDLEGKHEKDPIRKLVFKFHDKTEQKCLDDVTDDKKRVYKITKDFQLKCDQCEKSCKP